MLPIALNLQTLKIALIGSGSQFVRRYEILKSLEAQNLSVFSDGKNDKITSSYNSNLPKLEDLRKFKVIMIVGLEDKIEKAVELAKSARDLNILVNFEDVKEYCDFYFSAFTKRGDLILAVNTSGKSPALAARIKDYLAEIFSEKWQDYVSEIASLRKKWQEQNLSFIQIKQKTNEFIDEHKLLGDGK